MDEVIHVVFGGLLRLVGFIVLEAMFYRFFYYLGALPVWVATLGRLPTKDPSKLSRRNRILYAAIGITITALLITGWVVTGGEAASLNETSI